MKALPIIAAILLMAGMTLQAEGRTAGTTAATTAAAVAATAAATSAAASSNSRQAQQPPQPSGISTEGKRRWAKVGWLYCPEHLTEPRGCAQDTSWGTPENIEPWIDWLHRHIGSNARFLGLTFNAYEGDAWLYYGVPQED